MTGLFGEKYETEYARTRILEEAVNKKAGLHNCPFCGGKAHFFFYWSMSSQRDLMRAQCTKCYAESHSREFKEADGSCSKSITDPMFVAVRGEIQERWNRRYKPREKGKGRVQ